MIKNIFLTLIFVLYCSASFPNNSKAVITGIVKTADGKPAEFITVSLKNTSYGTCTDADGNFKFEAPSGKYTMQVYSIIAHNKEFPVTVDADKVNTVADITILEKSKELETVVVTGQISPQSLKNSVYSVKIINQEKIQLRAATSVEDILNTELGVRFSNDLALGETKISLMGMDGQNVKVLLDGVPLLDRGDSRQSLSQIDVNSIDRIEMVEGPMSVVYGSDALAGVINIITKKGKGQKFSANARILEESVGDEYNFFTDEGVHNESLGFSLANRNWRGTVNGSRNEFGGWKNGRTDRSRFWQPKSQYLGGGTVGYNNDKLDIWYRLDYAYEDIYTPAPYSTITYNLTDKDFITNRFTHQLQSEWRLNPRFRLNSALSYQDYTRDSKAYNVNVQTNESELVSNMNTALFNSFYFRTTASWFINHQFSLQPGVEVKYDEGSGDRIGGKPSITDYAAYISAEIKPLSWLNIRPGVRFIYNTEYKAPPAVPSINTKFILTEEWDLRLGYGYGFRAPSINELYFSFHDSNHNIDGNTNLTAEHSNSFTGSLAWNKKFNNRNYFTSLLSGFYNDFNDRITTAERADKPGYYQYINIDKYKTVGGTWSSTFSNKNWNATLGFSYVGYYNRFQGTAVSGKSTTAPEYTWSPEVNSGITYNFIKLKGKVALFYKYTGKYEKYQFDNDDQLFMAKRNAFNWMDLTLTKEIVKGLNATAGAKNLFNVRSLDDTTTGTGHGSGSGTSMSYGTSFFVGLIYNWN